MGTNVEKIINEPIGESNKVGNPQTIRSEYFEKTHSFGRWMTFYTILIFLAVPTIICIKLGISLDIKEVLIASFTLIAIFTPLAIAEIPVETPIMGTSFYLATITGNIYNLKLPAALNALKMANVQPGTEEADTVIGVAVSVASFVTMLSLCIGILLLAPLQPLLDMPAVKSATTHILPALFGSLTLGILSSKVGGGVVIKGRLKAAIIPLIIASVLFLMLPDLYVVIQGPLILLFIAIIYFTTKAMYKRGKITVTLPEDNVH